MPKYTVEQVNERIEAGAQHTERKYRIVRFYHPSLNRSRRAIPNGDCLTEAEAQAHCHRADTRKDGQYFDGYELMPGLR